MASITLPNPGVLAASRAVQSATEEPWVRWILIAIAWEVLRVFLFLALAIVFSSSL